MDKRAAAERVADLGVTSVQFLLASALGLLLFLAVANVVVVQYGRGALRSALEQGARAGTVGGSVACEEIAGHVIYQLLGGAMSEDLEIGCAVVGGAVRADGRGEFDSWTPLTGGFPVDISVTAVLEP